MSEWSSRYERKRWQNGWHGMLKTTINIVVVAVEWSDIHHCLNCWLCIVKGALVMKPNGVVVVMFCLHEWAWSVHWFDSGLVEYIFSSTMLALQHWINFLVSFPSDFMYFIFFTMFYCFYTLFQRLVQSVGFSFGYLVSACGPWFPTTADCFFWFYFLRHY